MTTNEEGSLVTSDEDVYSLPSSSPDSPSSESSDDEDLTSVGEYPCCKRCGLGVSPPANQEACLSYRREMRRVHYNAEVVSLDEDSDRETSESGEETTDGESDEETGPPPCKKRCWDPRPVNRLSAIRPTVRSTRPSNLSGKIQTLLRTIDSL